MSGVDVNGRVLRKGAAAAIASFAKERGGDLPSEFTEVADRISRGGGTPLALAEGKRILGIIHLGDVVKPGMKQRIAQLRAMGIRPVMITGDNPVTAEAIAREAGMTEFLAQATPADKLAYIRREQSRGRLVAMTGDGTNDAPALAQADVGLAMASGTTSAKEAGNMIDLDSNPTKLIEVVAIGKQLLLTRGALTTFSLSSGLAIYVAIMPAVYPILFRFNFLHLTSTRTAILAAIITSAIRIPALLPVALHGVSYRPVPTPKLIRQNILVYGLGGIIMPLAVIWILDRLLAVLASQ